jgi:isoquinoline 1-oxidoreductase beta subunit
MAIVKTHINRRSFLKVSAAAGGGVVLGFSWLASCTPTPEQVLAMPEEWFEINAYLKIGENGVVTIISPNPEIGQNVKTSMPMIVAEELDVDWNNVIVEQGALDTDSFSAQYAGGSNSIRRGWESLRMAGATARRMLMEAAAQQWEVPVSELTTDMGEIIHESSGRRLGYGEVASVAAGLTVPDEVELKDPADFKIIGTSRKNVDGLKIVKGEPLFGFDTYRDGMLVAMLAHPPAFGMTLKSHNGDDIKTMAGIRDVFSFSTQPPGESRSRPGSNTFTELVAVVGESTWQVMKAKKALKVEWEVESPLENTENYEAELESLISRGGAEPARRDGNPEAAFARAAQVIERTYSAPFMAHNTMEPMNFFAHVTDDRAELEGPVQTPQSLRGQTATVLGMEEDQVTVMMTRQGGGFGRRLYGNFGVEAAVISKHVGAPVKLIYSREDDMTQGTYRPAYRVTYRAALDAENNLIGLHIKGVGVHGSPVFANRFPAGAVENYLVENYRYDTNISTGAWRAPRSHFIAGAEQSFLDEVAEAAGKDPIEFRLELFDRAINDPVGEDNEYDAERYAGVLRLVRDKSNWDSDTPGVYRGVSAYFCHRSYVAQIVDIVMRDNQPRVQKVWCGVDCGIVINPDAARNIIEGGIIDGIGHSMYSELTFKDGQPQQNNFDTYRLIRHSEAPQEIETFFVDNGIDPTGLGEPGLPPAVGALANAMYRATGERFYDQPFVSNERILG